MFKKFTKPTMEADLSMRPINPFGTDFTNAMPVSEPVENEEPETTIAAHVEIKGTLCFQHCLRIDGVFEGELQATGKLIIGPTGSVRANIDLDEAYISGKVVGDIRVKKRLVLRGQAEVKGDITAPLISVDEGVSIIGSLNVTHVDHDETYVSI